ncbi:hypothetical protein BB934_40185 (plasmid) [Microvirga ossetica]|uniref:Uncharacterized protein n=1 Tax=Microvirga ossetica TaxID=1882682 RepID=A0A1B2EWT6_9HYPH|nr:hypothetical protein [Microvirga ossetica]ANY84425.1 hypothetical protein BB934_40185 [Microvirga ossetica]
MAVFYMACDQLLEQKPFLIMDFRSRRFFRDDDRDGCVDATGTLALPEIDPADFMSAVDGAEEFCNEDLPRPTPAQRLGICPLMRIMRNYGSS